MGDKKRPQAIGCAAALGVLVMSSQEDARAPWQVEPPSPIRAAWGTYAEWLYTVRLLNSMYAARCAVKQFSIAPCSSQAKEPVNSFTVMVMEQCRTAHE
jgi:hypothetical protein